MLISGSRPLLLHIKGKEIKLQISGKCSGQKKKKEKKVKQQLLILSKERNSNVFLALMTLAQKQLAEISLSLFAVVWRGHDSCSCESNPVQGYLVLQSELLP